MSGNKWMGLHQRPSGDKWVALSLFIVLLWGNVVAIAMLFIYWPVGLVLTTVAIPFTIGVYKEFLSDWSRA
jgi:hypothetical protein